MCNKLYFKHKSQPQQRRAAVWALLLMLLSLPAAAWLEQVPQASPVGQGQLRWLGMEVYSATLWAPQGQYQADQTHALELQYQWRISREQLADTSMKEMQRLGLPTQAQWRNLMLQAFRDVRPGDKLIGVWRPQQGETTFYFVAQGQKLAEPTQTIRDAHFGSAFFAIWLDPQARDAALRQSLLGLNRKEPSS